MCSETEVFCFGERVYYLSRQSNEWIPAVVQGHVMQGQRRFYNLDVQEAADPSRVMSREQYQAKLGAESKSIAPGVSPHPVNVEVFCFGEQVLYLSRSTGQWIPAVVEGHVMMGQELHYQLDVQEEAHPSRVKRLEPSPPAPSGSSYAMAPTIPALAELPGPEVLSPEPASLAKVEDANAVPPALSTKVDLEPSMLDMLEDSVALTIASSAPRPKAIANPAQGDRQQERIEHDTSKEPEITKTVLERVERPSDLFSKKTFFDEPQFGPSTPTFCDTMSLSFSMNLMSDNRQGEGAEGAVREERLSEIFSHKTFLDGPHFGLSTSDSLDESLGEKSSSFN